MSSNPADPDAPSMRAASHPSSPTPGMPPRRADRRRLPRRLSENSVKTRAGLAIAVMMAMALRYARQGRLAQVCSLVGTIPSPGQHRPNTHQSAAPARPKNPFVRKVRLLREVLITNLPTGGDCGFPLVPLDDLTRSLRWPRHTLKTGAAQKSLLSLFLSLVMGNRVS